MDYKLNTYYIVTKGSSDNIILVGDRLYLDYRKNKNDYSTLGEYTMFLPPRKTDKSFYGLPSMNSVYYFKTIEEVNERMKEIEIKYDIELVQEIINKKEEEINKLKIKHKIK